MPALKINPVEQERIKSFFRRIFQGLWVKHANLALDWKEYNINDIHFEQAFQSSKLLHAPELNDIWKSGDGFGQNWQGLCGYRLIPFNFSVPNEGCMGICVIYSSLIGVCHFTKKGSRPKKY